MSTLQKNIYVKLIEVKQIAWAHLNSKSKSWNLHTTSALQISVALLYTNLCYTLDSEIIAGKGISLLLLGS